LELFIFHYHLQPGGVTGVITKMVEGITGFSEIVDRTCVVSGSPPETPVLPGSVGLEVMPAISYISAERLADYAPQDGGNGSPATAAVTATSSGTSGTAGTAGTASPADTSVGPVGRVSDAAVAAGTAVLAQRITRELQERFGGENRVWWVHNHHLGKNPAFTMALADIARTHPQQRIIFHIHDFPESGRHTNLRLLERAGVGDLYPTGPGISFVTINSRDRDILADAGVHPVTYLPNPVTVSAPAAPDKAEHASPRRAALRRRLVEAYGVEFALFTPDDQVFIYPVRAIRRKNVFEAALITMLQERPTSLIVTLPGVSHQEKKYSAMVEHAFRDGTVPGLFGVGTSLEDHGITFPELLDSADAVISSSVQEGFGYQYITPLELGLPLIARRLDIMADVEPLFEGYPHTWYTSLRVPGSTPSLSGPYQLLRFRYEERLDRLVGRLSQDVIDALYTDLDNLLSPEVMEYSYLLPHMQYVVLQDIRRNPGFRKEVADLNRDVLEQTARSLATPGVPGVNAIEQRFGLKGVTAGIDRILQAPSPGITVPDQPDRPSPSGLILRRFAALEYQRLLYE
jgi:hypothetical protein